MMSSLVETAGLCHPRGERQERKGCSFRMLTSLPPREFTIHYAPASLGGVAHLRTCPVLSSTHAGTMSPGIPTIAYLSLLMSPEPRYVRSRPAES